MNTNLLKEAIAEADAIKKMAIENAKASLNEAFDSKVKSMLAARLAEEADDPEGDLEEDYEEEKMEEKKHAEDPEEEGDDEGYGMEEGGDMEDEKEADEAFDLDAILAELEKGDDDKEVMEGDDEGDEDGEKESYNEEEEGDDEIDEEKEEEVEDNVDEEIDITALLAEMEDGDDKEMEEAKHSDDDDDEKEEPKEDKDEVAVLEEEMMSLLEKMKMVKEAKKKKMMPKKSPEQEELQEIKRQAAELAQKVNETNLINAKLLYLNKILRKYNLSEQQKLKVISAFDKAGTTREAKIVHESLDQAFSVKNDNTKGSLKESIGFASKAAGTSTKRVINEGVITNADAQVSRWQKLAGIIK